MDIERAEIDAICMTIKSTQLWILKKFRRQYNTFTQFECTKKLMTNKRTMLFNATDYCGASCNDIRWNVCKSNATFRMEYTNPPLDGIKFLLSDGFLVTFLTIFA